jgi:hypothetical protein
MTSDDVRVLLNKSQRACRMEMASSCIDRQIKELFKLCDELIQWENKCLETQSFCTPTNASAIDFEIFHDEIMYKTIH